MGHTTHPTLRAQGCLMLIPFIFSGSQQSRARQGSLRSDEGHSLNSPARARLKVHTCKNITRSLSMSSHVTSSTPQQVWVEAHCSLHRPVRPYFKPSTLSASAFSGLRLRQPRTNEQPHTAGRALTPAPPIAQAARPGTPTPRLPPNQAGCLLCWRAPQARRL